MLTSGFVCCPKRHFIIGNLKAKCWKFGPSPCVDVANTIENDILRVVSMAAGNRFISIFHGTICRVYHYVFSEEPVKELPFLCIFGHMHGFCP